MKDIGKPMVNEVCSTCGNHDAKEEMWMMFPGTDIFAMVPFHAVHTILEKDEDQLNYAANKLQSSVKEKSFIISEKGVLSLLSMVSWSSLLVCSLTYDFNQR